MVVVPVLLQAITTTTIHRITDIPFRFHPGLMEDKGYGTTIMAGVAAQEIGAIIDMSWVC
jgi:hypothetical protein